MEVKCKIIFFVTFLFFTMTYLSFNGDWCGKIFYIMINQELHARNALGRMDNKSTESNNNLLRKHEEMRNVIKNLEYSKGSHSFLKKGISCNARQIISDLYSSHNNRNTSIENIIKRLSTCKKVYYPSNPKCASRTVRSVAKTASIQNHFNLWDYAKHLYFDFDNESQEKTLMQQLHKAPGMA